ncbi:hypothetical protein [Sutcliffiella sp. NC1]|uniref:hypothetical protein n=1 Tax=Sutcliffiella sp. NC1 TaxID=3004096 RepID=UPI0022DE635C|nr:hypothetical protein [Sutcliffiella sp. NC1]WBL15768.1 hypothetical protein O1A01_03705 [Sutcliffiella sp. NC1]
MKDNEWKNPLIDELKSLPKPDYEHEFDEQKQDQIHETLMKFSNSYKRKKKSRERWKRISVGFASIAALILFIVVFIPFHNESNNANVADIESFEQFFHQKMKEMNKGEQDFSYSLIHSELNAVHRNDAIAIFTENKNSSETIYIAYFEKQTNQWEWIQTRGAQWDSPVNWSSMNSIPYIYSGLINDLSILEVYAGDVQAKIITIEGDKRFWYAVSPIEEVEVMFVTEDGKEKIPHTELEGLQDSPEYLAEDSRELSMQDSETAYEIVVNALTDYYRAIWSGSDIELSAFMENENLIQYTEKKIQSERKVYITEEVNVEIGAWEVDYVDDEHGGFLYFKIPAEIFKDIGSYAEVTEFLVRNVNGKLVIVDWYTGAKDSYDFLVRGENETIDKPNIWDDSEWVQHVVRKQNE